MKEIEKLSMEAKVFHEKIMALKNSNEEIERLYYGTQVFFSPVKQSNLLILGFNPGSGYHDANKGKLVQKFKPERTHEYITCDYDLANQTRGIFESISKMEDLENSVKSNIYFTATKNIREFNKLTNAMKKVDILNDFWHNSKLWQNTIIEFVSPNLILCEGFQVYKDLDYHFAIEPILEMESLKVGKIDFNDKKIIVVSYKRVYSNILNPELIAKTLDKYIK